jgi:acyl carrier protein
MNSELNIKDKLVNIFNASQIMVSEDLDWNRQFAELGILLDSVGMLQLAIGIENEFDFEVLPEHIKSGIFDSPAAMLSFVQVQLNEHENA